MVARLGAAHASKPMPVKVRGPEAAAAALVEDEAARAPEGADAVVSPVVAAGAADRAELVGLVAELVGLVVALVVAVARTSSTVDSRAPQVASTWTSCAVKCEILVRATRSAPVCALRVPTVVGLEVVAAVARSEPG